MAGNKAPSYQIKKDEITIVFEAKALIEGEKPSIEARKKAFLQIIENVEGYSPSLNNLVMIFDSFYDAEFFSRKDIMEVCGIQVSSAGEVLSKLKETRVIEPVVGHGKGKYRFII